MLQPREADIPALFFFLVVLPLVTYILLGKWNEAAKKKARITVLAKLASEEAFNTDVMTAADVVPFTPLPNIVLHVCARCFRPATTRCSRCKSVRYCSGKCQIIHWRQGHKQDCQQWKDESSNVFVSPSSVTESSNTASSEMHLKSSFSPSDPKESMHNIECLDIINDPKSNLLFRRDSHNTKRDLSSREDNFACILEESNTHVPTSSLHTSITELPSNETPKRYKSGNSNSIVSDSASTKRNHSSQAHGNGSRSSRNVTHETHKVSVQDRSVPETCTSGEMNPISSEKNVPGSIGTETGSCLEKFDFPGLGFSSTSETVDSISLIEKTPTKGGTRFKKPPYTVEPNSIPKKLSTKPAREHTVSGSERKTCKEKESYGQEMTSSMDNPLQEANGNSKSSDKKMAGARTSQKPPKHNTGANFSDYLKKNKVLFPYEDLVKFFQCEISDVHPRGLLNCGNSCYANAVLQCLTCTKPLLVYLLRRIHSKSCQARDWCLMCELELHVSMLREGRGPMSPSKVLSNMRSIGCRMGGGNQEDAHEFLRLLVMSMQSVCLEGFGGEKEIDSRLQESTLIQQLFGGSIRSKVKCLRCELESERYENIMDLTLEIHGRVESLEDALTQFTAPEDLDGDNMYRCGRCCAYVKARKQLSVHEAPNILTIVLKRFQTGKYGKINKCVTFPDMLDMIPFMTGMSDSPPLYLLYAVVVHLDTLNASFSGHYVSYVKDLQGTWFRIDDTEVQAVPLGQVMSEGAYMLFYSRSFPRPPRIYSNKTFTKQNPGAAKHSMSKPPRFSRHESPKSRGILFASSANAGTELRPETRAHADAEQGGTYIFKNGGINMLPKRGTVCGSAGMDFSDTASSDWTLFTSSDESSFTTESTSDSFSTVDYNDAGNLDPISSLFSPVYIPEYTQKSSVSCREFSHCGVKTRFFSESKGFVLDSSSSSQPLGYVHKGKSMEALKTREQFQR